MGSITQNIRGAMSGFAVVAISLLMIGLPLIASAYTHGTYPRQYTRTYDYNNYYYRNEQYQRTDNSSVYWHYNRYPYTDVVYVDTAYQYQQPYAYQNPYYYPDYYGDYYTYDYDYAYPQQAGSYYTVSARIGESNYYNNNTYCWNYYCDNGAWPYYYTF